MDTKEKLNFIVNPNAGCGKTTKAIGLIVDILKEKGIDYHIDYATTPELAREFSSALEAKGEKKIIIVGGDGTFSEVLNGVKNPSDLTFGFIPAGTGNDFAKTLGISKDPKKALEHVLNSKVTQFDYFQGRSRRALNTVSTGIDIAIIQKYNSYKKRSKLNYYRALLGAVFKFKFPCFRLKIDDTKDIPEKDYFVVSVCNGQYFGGGMKISPNSKPDDGKITLVSIHGMPRRKIFFRMLDVLKGKHIGKSYSEEYICDHITLNDNQLMTVNFDGELIPNEPFDIKVIKNGLNVFLDKQ
ncbi:MAG: diacylglycerol kinase family lipid kinase [Christensenellaceae bacterium]|jgi:YegS/Rv2252/BmrU family lipid kinase|nr:diacylglycerol kinase family lipid kinase [Christensenellaceae bacterium]